MHSTLQSETPERRLKVTCYGAGNIGRSWALLFAQHGHDVRLYDRALGAAAAALGRISESVLDLERIGVVTDPAAILGRVTVVADAGSALAGSDYVQESIVESLEAKREAFLEIAHLAPASAILASSCSTIPGSEFMDVAHRERCIVVHPVNPPHVIRAVEVVPALWTSESTLTRVSELLRSMGQTPIILRREIYGFVINRLQFAVINEALHLVRRGICAPEAIDAAMRDGLGPRWALCGVFGTSHLNAVGGIREYYTKFPGLMEQILGCLHAGACVPDEALTELISADLEKRLPAEQVPALQRARDLELIRLRKLMGTDLLQPASAAPGS
jgi:L-gulonate 3-dehydrogenase